MAWRPGFAAPPVDGTRSPDIDGKGRIGDFELLREVGRGGMGVVYEARQISLDKRVAVKLLPFAAVLDAKQIARFKSEAQAAAQVHHPNIVPVFAIGVERGIHYYAMHFVDGQPLDQVIKGLRESGVRSTRAGRKERFQTVARLGIQAAEALHAAHEYGVVHRDIKPSNLLLEASGKLWITDFGLARCQRDATLTKTGDVVGTMRYMSPEQAAGKPGLIDHRSDIYSLGVTLYELLCLHPAFPEENNPALLKSISEHQPPPPRHFYPDIPADLQTVVLKAMANGRDERYATAQELADDLRRVLDGQPTLAKPPRISDRAFKWVWRRRGIVAAALSVFVVAFIGLAVGLGIVAREKHRAEANFRRAERRFQDARKVVDEFGIQLSSELEGVAGTSPQREKLIRRTLQYYQSFIDEDAKDNPALRADLAATYGKIATLMDEAGSLHEAIEAHEKSVALFEELTARQPHHAELKLRLGQSKNNLALVLQRAGEVEKAEALLKEAVRIEEALASESPNDDVRLDLAMSYNNLGKLRLETGAIAEARETLQKSVAALRSLIASQPQDCERLNKLAKVSNILAATYREEIPLRAAELHGQALKLQAKAAELQPADQTVRREMGLTLNNVGAAWSRTSQIGEAARCYEQAIEIQQQLVAQSPSQRLFQRDLAISENNLGMLHTRAGRLSEAESSLRRSIELQNSLSEAVREDIELHSSLGGAYHNLGVVLEKMELLADAAAAFSQAIVHQRTALDHSPTSAQYRDFLAKHQASQERLTRRLRSDPSVPEAGSGSHER